MAKKQETGASSRILVALQRNGYFKKISDRVQVGIPDILGCYDGIFLGIEVKAVSSVPEDGMVPKKGDHPFSKAQVFNLKEIHNNGGLAVGMVVCGKQAIFCYYHQINEEGRVDWNACAEACQHIADTNDLKRFFWR